MIGLLYKDYAATNGKYYILGLTVTSVLLILLRFAGFNENVDTLVSTLLFTVITIFFLIIPFFLEEKLIKVDEGRKQRQYYMSLPISKSQYVASKYVYLLIAYYILMSLGCFLIIIASVNMKYIEALQLLNGINTLLPILLSSLLIVSGVELPFLILLGTKRGNAVRTGLFVLLFFCIIVILLFGDLEALERFNLMDMMAYVNNHYELMIGLRIFLPAVALILYYVSFRITVRLFGGKEWEDE